MKKIYFTLLIILSVFMFKNSAYAKVEYSDFFTDKSNYVNLLVHSSGGGSATGGTHSGSSSPNAFIQKNPRFYFCDEEGVLKTFKVIGIILNIAKIAVPIILIIIGSIEYGKAAIADDSEALEKTTHAFIVKVIVGLAIFLIPTIVVAAVNLAKNDKDKQNETGFLKCWRCFTGDKSCNGFIDKYSGSSSGSNSGNSGSWEDNTSNRQKSDLPSKPENRNSTGTGSKPEEGSSNSNSKPENPSNGYSKPENNSDGQTKDTQETKTSKGSSFQGGLNLVP